MTILLNTLGDPIWQVLALVITLAALPTPTPTPRLARSVTQVLTTFCAAIRTSYPWVR